MMIRFEGILAVALAAVLAGSGLADSPVRPPPSDFSPYFLQLSQDLSDAATELHDYTQQIVPNNHTMAFSEGAAEFWVSLLWNEHARAGALAKRDLTRKIVDVFNFMRRYRYSIPVHQWNGYSARYNRAQQLILAIQARAPAEIRNYPRW